MDRFLGKKMNLKVSIGYFKRLKKLFKSKLNGGNLAKRTEYSVP